VRGRSVGRGAVEFRRRRQPRRRDRPPHRGGGRAAVWRVADAAAHEPREVARPDGGATGGAAAVRAPPVTQGGREMSDTLLRLALTNAALAGLLAVPAALAGRFLRHRPPPAPPPWLPPPPHL